MLAIVSTKIIVNFRLNLDFLLLVSCQQRANFVSCSELCLVPSLCNYCIDVVLNMRLHQLALFRLQGHIRKIRYQIAYLVSTFCLKVRDMGSDYCNNKPSQKLGPLAQLLMSLKLMQPQSDRLYNQS